MNNVYQLTVKGRIRICVRHHTSNKYIAQVISGTEGNVERRSKTWRTSRVLKLIRKSKVGKTTLPDKRPFRNSSLKKRLLGDNHEEDKKGAGKSKKPTLNPFNLASILNSMRVPNFRVIFKNRLTKVQ